MKKCKECGESKDESLFYGLQGECKECTKLRVRANHKKIGRAYDFSEKGVIRVIYKTQKRNQMLRGHGELPYTKEQLSRWMYKSNFKGLFDSWVEQGNSKDLKPSIDRIDDFKGYSFDNIKLVTWGENKKHQADDIMSGTGTGGTRCKTLFQFDKSRQLIASYVSYSSAARVIGYSLEYQIKKGVKCRSGYYWSYSCDLKE